MAGMTSGHPERLTQAEENFRWILEVDPSHVEVTLRLGHVLKLMGREEEATRCLRWVKEHTQRGEYLLVADLVLGDLSRVKGDIQEAIRFYRAALEIEPGCQSASTALGLALHRAGDLEGSREIVKQLLIEKRQPPHRVDGWWRYLLGQSYHHALLMAEMRQEVHW